MRKKIFYFLFFLSISGVHTLTAASDTTYFDKTWEITTRDAAAYYRPVPAKEGNGYRVKDYYMSGKLQMTAISLQLESDVFDGQAHWYYETGELQQEAKYIAGVLEGLFVVFAKDGTKLSEGLYKNGEPADGSFMILNDVYHLLETYEDGLPQKKILTDVLPENKTRAEGVFKDGQINYVEYFNREGKLAAKSIYNSELVIEEGQEVSVNYNPLSLYKIVEYQKGVPQNPAKYYYSSGGLQREEFWEGYNLSKTVYYNENGKELGTLIYQDNLPFNGVYYTFHNNNFNSRKNDIFQSIEYYTEGKQHGLSKKFYDNGSVMLELQYEQGIKTGTSKFYDINSKLLYEGIYKDGDPFEGIFIDESSEERVLEEYKKGTMVVSKVFFKTGKLKSEKTADKQKFYDLKGNEAGSLIYKDNLPYEGREVVYYDGILYEINDYKKGIKVKQEQYTDNGIITSKRVFDADEYLISQDEFYKNEKLKSSTTYYNYSTQAIKYFDQNGKSLGEINYLPKKNGTEFTFNEDSISRMDIYKDGVVVGGMLYREGNKPVYAVEPNGKGIYYNEDGSILGTAEFKDGVPYNGVVCVFDEYDLILREKKQYRNGKLHGEQISYKSDYSSNENLISSISHYEDGIRNGTYEEYEEGVLIKFLNYSDDQLDGEAKFYNKQGVLLADAIYKNNLPYTGVFYDYGYDYTPESSSTFVDGQLDYNTYFDLNGAVVKREKYGNGVISEATSFVENSRQYKLNYLDGVPDDGEIFEYNTLTRYINGKKVSETVYTSEGVMQKESEVIYQDDYNYTETRYYPNGKKHEVLKYVDSAKDGEVLFYSAEEKLIAKGIYKKGYPVSGIFIYRHQYNQDDYIKMEIKKNTFKASFVKDNKTGFVLNAINTTAADEVELNEQISTFLNMIQQKSSEYLIDMLYYY